MLLCLCLTYPFILHMRNIILIHCLKCRSIASFRAKRGPGCNSNENKIATRTCICQCCCVSKTEYKHFKTSFLNVRGRRSPCPRCRRGTAHTPPRPPGTPTNAAPDHHERIRRRPRVDVVLQERCCHAVSQIRQSRQTRPMERRRMIEIDGYSGRHPLDRVIRSRRGRRDPRLFDNRSGGQASGHLSPDAGALRPRRLAETVAHPAHRPPPLALGRRPQPAQATTRLSHPELTRTASRSSDPDEAEGAFHQPGWRKAPFTPPPIRSRTEPHPNPRATAPTTVTPRHPQTCS